MRPSSDEEPMMRSTLDNIYKNLKEVHHAMNYHKGSGICACEAGNCGMPRGIGKPCERERLEWKTVVVGGDAR